MGEVQAFTPLLNALVTSKRVRNVSGALNFQKGDEDSPFKCDVDYSGTGETVRRKSSNQWVSLCECFDSSLSPDTAASMVVEGIEKKTAQPSDMLEALRCLHANAAITSAQASSVALPPQGLFRLVFCAGNAMPLLQLDARGGYIARGGGLDLRLSRNTPGGASTIKMDMLSTGLLKVHQTLSGRYSLFDDGTISAQFSQAKVGPVILGEAAAAAALELCRIPFTLQTFFAHKDILAMHCNVKGKTAVLVFQMDSTDGRSHRVSRVQAHAMKYARQILTENMPERDAPIDVRSQKSKEDANLPRLTGVGKTGLLSRFRQGATAIHETIAPLQRQQSLMTKTPALTPKEAQDEKEAKQKRMQEEMKIGKYDSPMHYFDSELPGIYAMLAGPILFKWAKVMMPFYMVNFAHTTLFLENMFTNHPPV